ncbi:MAG: hypothetical protein GEV07_06200 [Streptosporangiales bacterium]|nr:hypothetical protein [Streptosporangiales bacterium]
MKAYKEQLAPSTYEDGHALHLVVAAWDEPEPLDTKYGRGCSKAYPLSERFTADMHEVARNLAGRADDPSLYVSMFMGFNTYACTKDAYKPDSLNEAYYKALKDRYLEVLRIFHDEAPNARVSLGWDGWEARIDDRPERGGGPSMFKHFADVMRKSDFQSFGMRETDGSNMANVEAMVTTLGKYGPVMVAYHQPWEDPLPLFDREVRQLLTDDVLDTLVDRGLFAWSFTDGKPMSKSARVEKFLEDAVRTYGRKDR